MGDSLHQVTSQLMEISVVLEIDDQATPHLFYYYLKAFKSYQIYPLLEVSVLAGIMSFVWSVKWVTISSIDKVPSANSTTTIEYKNE